MRERKRMKKVLIAENKLIQDLKSQGWGVEEIAVIVNAVEHSKKIEVIDKE
jgi:hypothetical protein